eukprot:CAMPEP_0115173778 /NCGR_PEP_ID=MMETSP0270-20121206/3499_1 /TAXON_ID=71861 /ORGANISM="Scrippsiella trochoidea, Strain CCMP3099" /LENGTH=251 /DNA_ID=CAMNT_0002586597 /DNA_START=16 /DNA_END=771 /DNA_ORIENTATION=-
MSRAFSLMFICAALSTDHAAAEVAASEPLVGELSSELCDASDMECALSLRQLRASVLAPGSESPPREASLASAGNGAGPEADQERPVASLAETLHKKKNIKTGYHLTSPAICQAILAEGFRPGHGGWCGGAIYFAASHKTVWTKAIGTQSHTGCMLQVKVDMGRMKTMGPKCDMSMDAAKLAELKADSIKFNPGDGIEYVIFDPARVVSVKEVWHDPKLDATSNKLAPVRVDEESADEAVDASFDVIEDIA